MRGPRPVLTPLVASSVTGTKVRPMPIEIGISPGSRSSRYVPFASVVSRISIPSVAIVMPMIEVVADAEPLHARL